jgi:hypothetical protein
MFYVKTHCSLPRAKQPDKKIQQKLGMGLKRNWRGLFNQQNYPAVHTEWLKKNHVQPGDSQFSSVHFGRVPSAYT